jgi:hypothetical protein
MRQARKDSPYWNIEYVKFQNWNNRPSFLVSIWPIYGGLSTYKSLTQPFAQAAWDPPKNCIADGPFAKAPKVVIPAGFKPESSL